VRRYLWFALTFFAGAVIGWLLTHRAAPPRGAEHVVKFSLDQSDPSDPAGHRHTDYTVYRVTSADRGIIRGTPAGPPADGPRPVIVTLVGRERVAYYGLPVKAP
jgi:hypothetical protein